MKNYFGITLVLGICVMTALYIKRTNEYYALRDTINNNKN